MNVSNLYRNGRNVLHSFRHKILRTQIRTAPKLKASYIADEVSVSKFHQDVIQQCFAKEDAGSVAELMADLELGGCAIIVVKEGNEILGGLIVFHYWSTGKKIMVVSWLCVDEKHRSRNIGSLLIEEAMSYAKANGALILLAEVKNPDFYPESHPAYGNPLRRARFYSRFDCKRLEVPCYIPAFNEEQEPVHGLMLTLFPLSEEQAALTEFYLPELAEFVDDLIGQDMDKESRDFVAACEGIVSLTPFRTLF